MPPTLEMGRATLSTNLKQGKGENQILISQNVLKMASGNQYSTLAVFLLNDELVSV
jgi:hypothetical protein